jgi:hypothetical protein
MAEHIFRGGILQPQAEAPRRCGTKAGKFQAGVQRPDGALPALAGPERGRIRREAAHCGEVGGESF